MCYYKGKIEYEATNMFGVFHIFRKNHSLKIIVMSPCTFDGIHWIILYYTHLMYLYLLYCNLG